MFISNAKNPKHALRKGRSLRKPILVISVVLVFCFLSIFSGLIGTFNRANAEVEQADWDKPLHSGNYWPLAPSNRLTVIDFMSEPVRNVSLEYAGTYVNSDGRTVVRLVYRHYNSIVSGVWHILAMKAWDPLDSLIDWDNPKTVMYRGTNFDARHCSYESLKNTVNSKIVPANVTNVGMEGVHEVNLRKNENEGGTTGAAGVREQPIDLVLKEGKTLSDLKLNGNAVDGLIDARLMADEANRRVYVANADRTTLEKSTSPYFSYTYSTVVPFGGSSSADSSDWKFGLKNDIRTSDDMQFRSSNAYVRYGVDKSGNKYIEVVHRMAKAYSTEVDYNQKPFAYRQVFSSAFADMLKPVTYTDENGATEQNIVAVVYRAERTDQAFSDNWNNNTDMPMKDFSIRVSSNDVNGVNYINTSPDGKYKYIEVAKKGDNGFVKSDGTSADPGVNIATNTANATQTFINSAASTHTGLPTITRYYIDESKLNEQTFNNILFYSALLSANNERGFLKYTAKTTTALTFRAGSKVNLDFDAPAEWRNNIIKGELSLIIGDKITSIALKSYIIRPNPNIKKAHFEWTVPFDITIPANTNVRLMGDADQNNSNLNIGGVTLSQDNQSLRMILSDNDIRPQIIQFADTMADTKTLSTALKPNIQEIFTDDTKIVGHMIYKGGLADIIGGNGNMHFDIPDDTAPESVVVNGKTKQGYKFTFNKPATNPQQNGWPSLEKDMPIRFNNTDVLTNSIPSESVVEQVQAKVVFNLNGGKIPATGTSAPASYTNRTAETDSITRIAPLNKNYRKIKDSNGNFVNNPDYKQNGFETAEGAAENRRMVGGVLADHDDKALTGDNLKYRQFVSQTPDPPADAPEGTYFKEWNTDPNGNGTKFEKTTPIDSGMTVYAIYEKQIPTGILSTQKKAIDLLLPISLVSIMATFALIVRRRVKKFQN